MKKDELWLHGTEVYFDSWQLPQGKQTHKHGVNPLSAIFLTTSQEFALDAASSSGGLCSATLINKPNILDMNNCSVEESEQYRLQVLSKPLGQKNSQIMDSKNWRSGWLNGKIMKFTPSCTKEAAVLAYKTKLALLARNTTAGVTAFNELQLLTRNTIEELVISAKELGYDGVIGNEIDTLHPTGEKHYRVLFVLTAHYLSKPVWIRKPSLKNS